MDITKTHNPYPVLPYFVKHLYICHSSTFRDLLKFIVLLSNMHINVVTQIFIYLCQESSVSVAV